MLGTEWVAPRAGDTLRTLRRALKTQPMARDRSWTAARRRAEHHLAHLATRHGWDVPTNLRIESRALELGDLQRIENAVVWSIGEGKMGMLKPLAQWVCDTCGQVIPSAGKGYLEWIRSDHAGRRRAHDFHIVHHAPASPRHPAGTCYQHEGARGRADADLRQFVGALGLVHLLTFLDVGPHHDRDYHGPEVSNFREFTEIIRRLHVPYYEEARRYWERAEADGVFGGMNEIAIYMPETLQQVIERYGAGGKRTGTAGAAKKGPKR